MKHQNLKISGALLLAGLAGAFQAPSAQAQFSKISEQEEIQAGRQAAAQAIKEYGQPLSQNDPRQRRVARLGQMFAAQSRRRNIPFSYTVLQNDKVLNAFAAPGGPIFVTTKLVSTAANDAELAYVLGHETGHIENKHIVNSVQKQQKVGLFAGIAGAILGRGRNAQAANVVGSLAVGALTSKYSRADEDDADNYGVRVMSRLGFDPRAAVSMLGKLGGGNTSGLAKFLASHPSPKSRQAKVTQLIQKENLLGAAQNAGGARLSLAGNDDSVYRPVSDSGDYAPTYNTPNYNTGAASTIRLEAPLRVVNSGNARVVLAPVAALASYAGGTARVEGQNSVVISRGGDYLRVQLGSDVATLNGRQVRLSAAPRVIGGRFYAPLGSVAAGLGGSASYDSAQNAVRVDFEGRSGILPLP
ncbi:MAG TPA: M48 family metalloprotease [Abditibacterium sp.]|jgi:Zn-dependent protease with chaperone function